MDGAKGRPQLGQIMGIYRKIPLERARIIFALLKLALWGGPMALYGQF